MIDHKTFLSLYQKGVITHKPLVQLEISNKIEQLLKSGLSKTRAVSKVAKDIGVSERTIYRACKSVTGFRQ